MVNDRELFVCLYVDDCLYCGDNELMAEFKVAIETRSKVRHLDGTEFLGLTIKYDLAAGVLELGQARYVEKVLKRIGFWTCTTRTTPMAKGVTLERLHGECLDKDLQTLYRHGGRGH